LLLILVGLADIAAAQMFSSRANRPSLSERLRGRQRSQRGTGPAAAETVGTVEGSERFIRGNRSAADFVGADLRERPTFVGAQAVDLTQDVRSAVEDLRPTRERDLNQQMRAPRGSQMYLPRLSVDFSFEVPTSREIGARLVTQLQATETLKTLGPIEVSVVDGKATLRGVVASERDREMAALVARFEPGISSVKNELQVRPPPSPTAPAPAPLNSSRPRNIPQPAN
jgi:hypothetical protein